MLGFIAGLLLVLLEIKLPPFLSDTCKYLGNMTTPLAMLFIGVAIHAVDFKELRPDKDMLAVFTSRFVISPAIVFLLALVIPMPVLMKKVFVIQAAMPMMTQSAIVAAAYGADAKYAAVLTTATTILSMAIIPLYMIILQ
jgi:predicted permease